MGPGLVKIKGMLTNTFVGMDKKGRLYAEVRWKISKRHHLMLYFFVLRLIQCRSPSCSWNRFKALTRRTNRDGSSIWDGMLGLKSQVNLNGVRLLSLVKRQSNFYRFVSDLSEFGGLKCGIVDCLIFFSSYTYAVFFVNVQTNI